MVYELKFYSKNFISANIAESYLFLKLQTKDMDK